MTTRVVRWTVSVIRLRAVSGRGHECNCNHSPLWFAGCRGSFADLAGCLVDRIAGMMVVGVVATLALPPLPCQTMGRTSAERLSPLFSSPRSKPFINVVLSVR
ncbi:hypothetical protein ECG_08242 [Echinococcus granulosus]|nr:hypothetical protein ECG_08243 [Echinococcus granulosus]KAH9278956.1 hypothetical protein ECG_08242 [Echinococcus granulosus]